MGILTLEPCPTRALRDELRHIQETLVSGYDLRPLWRGRALEQYAHEPLTVRRARALAAVLAAIPLPIRPEDRLVGTPIGVWAEHLPPDVDEATYERYHALDRATGERNFWTNYDHAAVDHAKILRVGLPGLLAETQAALDAQDDPARRTFLRSVAIALQAAIDFTARWEAACRQVAPLTDSERQRQLLAMADDLHALTLGAPHTFAQALQLIWLIQVIMAVEGRGAMAFGRMDQYLYPHYRQCLASGEEETARALLECLWAKLEEPFVPNPVQNIAIGGLTPDGHDATNELSYLLLEVTGAVGTPRSNLSARLHAGSPQRFRQACAELIKTGIGFPAVFNDDVLVPALCDLGIAIEDARDYAFVGCIETFLPGKMPPWSDSRVNLLAALDHVLHSGDPRTLATFEALMAAFECQVAHEVAEHCEQIAAIKRAVDPEQFTSPFLSALTADCIARGLDVNAGGARYPAFHGPAGMGLGSTADALAAIRWFIYDRRTLTWDELLPALDADYRGYEALRLRLLNEAPKYGNGDPYVDRLAARVVQVFTAAALAQRLPDGGRFVPLMAANVANIAAGKEVGATPDGRHALEPVSDAASPAFGRDRKGPTALIASLSTVDYRPVVGGTVVNVKFSPDTLAGEEGTALLSALIQTYFRQGGMQLQFNVTGRQVLEAARRNPEHYRDLVVRVSGFSALYVTLDPAVQADILARTEH